MYYFFDVIDFVASPVFTNYATWEKLTFLPKKNASIDKLALLKMFLDVILLPVQFRQALFAVWRRQLQPERQALLLQE